jgi:hypothetical protein
MTKRMYLKGDDEDERPEDEERMPRTVVGSVSVRDRGGSTP